MGNTKRKRNRKKEEQLKQSSMSMESFLRKILGITDIELIRAHLTHDDIKKMFPSIKRASIAQVLDDPALVSRGDVIYVKDSENRSIPYINDREKFLGNIVTPITNDLSSVMDTEEWSEPKSDTSRIRYEELESMSVYELVCLAKIYHETGQIANREIVIRELKSRNDSKQGVKRSKDKALKKERKYKNNNDDY